MERIRIGKNIAITWLLYESDGEIHNLEEKDLELYMVCGGFKYPVLDYTVTENAVAWTFPARLQTKTGYYSLVLMERNEALGIHSFDVAKAFCLEPNDALVNIATIIDEDTAIQVKSVLTYAHITNLASIDTVEGEDGLVAEIHLTNGKTFNLPLGSGGSGSAVEIVNNLTSGGTDKALSAEMGKVLKQLIDSMGSGINVVNNLTSTSTTDPLSANMGRELKRLIDSIEPGGSSVTIVDNLTEGGRTKALSAEQGKYLKSLIDAINTGSVDSGDIVQVMYSSVENSPGTPSSAEDNWHPVQQQGDVWMAIRFKSESTWGAWSVLQIGDFGAPYASFKSFIFTRSNASSVLAPTGGSYADPDNVVSTDGNTWSDGIPSGSGAIWMSSRIFTTEEDNAHGDANWSTPRIIGDTEFMDYEFSSVANPGTPQKQTPTSSNMNPNWSNTADASTIWMAMREVSNGVYKSGSSWMIMKIKGEDGADGTSVTIKGSLDDSANLPQAGNETGDGYLIDGNLWVWDGDSWVNVGQIKGDPGDNGQTPILHIKYSDNGTDFTANNGETPGNYIGLYWDYTVEDSIVFSDYTWQLWKGEDGFGYEYVFKATATSSAPNLPSSSPNTDDYVPTDEGWTDGPYVTVAKPYCWVAWRKKEDGEWSAWHGSASGKARLFSHYGANGADGTAGQGVVKSIVFKRGLQSEISQPGNQSNKYNYVDSHGVVVDNPVSIDGLTRVDNPNYGGTFADPVPYGWSDGVPAVEVLSDPDALDNTLWMTTRIFTDDGESPQQENWTSPVQATDTDNYDFEFALMQTNDGRPADPTTANRHGGSGTQVWFDPVLDADTLVDGQVVDFTQMYWMAFAAKVNGTRVGPWTILRIKGETGAPGVDGHDAKPIRIRNWSDVYGASLTGDDCIFSGFEEGAPFRDIIVITPRDYSSGEYPFDYEGSDSPVLLVTNYSANHPNGLSGTFLVGKYPTKEEGVAVNYSPTVAATRTDSAALFLSGIYYGVLQNLGAVYVQLLVATQAYIGSLTVDHLTTSIGTNSSIYMQGGLITVKDANGVTRMQIGQGVGDSTPVLKFYDASGNLLYDLGPNGIQWASDGAVYQDALMGERIALGRLCGIGQTIDIVYGADEAGRTDRNYYPFHLATRTSGGTVMYYNYDHKFGDGVEDHGWQPAATVIDDTSLTTIGDVEGVLVNTDKVYTLRPQGCNAELDVWPAIVSSILTNVPEDGWYLVNTEGFAENSSYPSQN